MKPALMILILGLSLMLTSGCGDPSPVPPASKSEARVPKDKQQKGNQALYQDSYPLPADVLVSSKKK